MVRPSKFAQMKRRHLVLPKFKCPSIDFRKLKTICLRPIKDFHAYQGIGNFEKINTPNGALFYRDNGAKILVVAHLDTVLKPRWTGVLNYEHDTHIYATSLDDRLGVYTALETLNKAGLEYDILLTTEEEAGNSTAQWFEPPDGKEYNWIAEFDRRGDDAVTYQYNDLDWKRALRSCGLHLEHGLYSDISEMSHLGVCAVNFGVGYQNNHSVNAYASLNTYRNQISRFLEFYNKYSEVEFKHSPDYNVITRTGFRFDPNEFGRFSTGELQMGIELYEQLEQGATFQSLGFNKPRITKSDLMRKRVIQPMSSRGSEDDQKVLVFPAQDHVENARNALNNQGFKADIVGKCLECNTHFQEIAGVVDVYCPKCRVIVNDRQLAFDKAEDAYREGRNIPLALADLPSKNPIIASCLAWLASDKISSQRIGMALKLLRENISEKTAKTSYDELIRKRIIRSSKKMDSYPTNNKGRVMLTQLVMSKLMTEYSIDEDAHTQKNFQKWVSKIETGHPGAWAYKKDVGLIEDYTLLLRDLVEGDWILVIDSINNLNLTPVQESLNRIHVHLTSTYRIDKPVEDIVKPVLKKVGLKYRLDTSNKAFDFTQNRVGEGIETSWVPVETKVDDKIAA